MGYLLRIAIFLILGWLAYRLIRRLVHTDEPPVKPQKQEKIEVIPCAICGVHVPDREALTHDGKVYCSVAHMELSKNSSD